MIAFAQPDPKNTRGLAHWIVLKRNVLAVLDLVDRLGWYSDRFALNTEFPTVIDAAQGVVFIACQGHRSTSVWAGLIKKSGLAVCGSKGHVVLSEKAHTQGLAIGLNVGRSCSRNPPILLHHPTHWGSIGYASQQIIFFFREHV